MISSLTGKVQSITSASFEVDVAGVGYTVFAPASLLASLSIDAPVRVPTHMVVREDSMTLYGFKDADQRELFQALIAVTGVGPKLGLAVIGSFEPDNFRRVIASGDIESLKSVPGVGKRSAERIILELKERLGGGSPEMLFDTRLVEVREALIGLGYTAPEIRAALERVDTQEGDVESTVRAALKELARI